MNQIPTNQLGSAEGMSIHERIKQLYHGYDGASFQFKDGYELAKNEAAQIAKDTDELYAALECEAALDMPTDQGRAVLERHGWDYQDRFDLPASEFVKRIREAAMAKARGEKQ